MKGIEERGGAFVCAIACSFPEDMANEDFCVRGECRGIILHEEKGTGGFGYDPLFYFPQFNKTLAEVPAEQKNLVSHRANAIKMFAEKLKALKIIE